MRLPCSVSLWTAAASCTCFPADVGPGELPWVLGYLPLLCIPEQGFAFSHPPACMEEAPAPILTSVSSTGSLPVWLLLLLCAGLIVATILLLQLAFPGFL